MTIYLCSPFKTRHTDTHKRIKEALKYHKYACDVARLIVIAGHEVIAPHLYYPLFLDDTCDVERDMGINSGIKLLHVADAILINKQYGVSAGMSQEIKKAKELGIMILEAYDIKGVESLLKYHSI